jgi:hypothetical protein
VLLLADTVRRFAEMQAEESGRRRRRWMNSVERKTSEKQSYVTSRSYRDWTIKQPGGETSRSVRHGDSCHPSVKGTQAVLTIQVRVSRGISSAGSCTRLPAISYHSRSASCSSCPLRPLTNDLPKHVDTVETRNVRLQFFCNWLYRKVKKHVQTPSA